MSNSYQTRRKRINNFKQQIKKEWVEYFWNEFVLKYSYKLNWNGISRNPNITMDIIEKYSDNPNITMDIIQDNPDKSWNWIFISLNKFTKNKTDFTIKEYYKHLMAFRIQNRWKNSIVNPNCIIGQKKIERDMVFAGL